MIDVELEQIFKMTRCDSHNQQHKFSTIVELQETNPEDWSRYNFINLKLINNYFQISHATYKRDKKLDEDMEKIIYI